MNTVGRWVARLLCWLGAHSVRRESGRYRSTVGIPGGTMTDAKSWESKHCDTCGRAL